MALVYRSVPADISHAMASGLENLTKSRSFSTTHFARALPKDRHPSEFMPVLTLPLYSLGLSDLTETRSLSKAVQTGWRSLVGDSEGVYAISDVHTGGAAGPVFAQVNTGPFVKGLDHALRSADSDLHLRARKYETRLLLIPALYVIALWLVDAKGGVMIVPVGPCPPYLRANVAVSEDDFLNTVLPAAQEVQLMHRQLDAGGGP